MPRLIFIYFSLTLVLVDIFANNIDLVIDFSVIDKFAEYNKTKPKNVSAEADIKDNSKENLVNIAKISHNLSNNLDQKIEESPKTTEQTSIKLTKNEKINNEQENNQALDNKKTVNNKPKFLFKSKKFFAGIKKLKNQISKNKDNNYLESKTINDEDIILRKPKDIEINKIVNNKTKSDLYSASYENNLVKTSLNFAEKQIEINPEMEEKLDFIARNLIENQNYKIRVIGYASEKDGLDDATRRRASLERVIAVRRYLVNKGVGTRQINLQASIVEQAPGSIDSSKNQVDILEIK